MFKGLVHGTMPSTWIFEGRDLEAEHGHSLQSRFYMPIHTLLVHPSHGHPSRGSSQVVHLWMAHVTKVHLARGHPLMEGTSAERSSSGRQTPDGPPS